MAVGEEQRLRQPRADGDRRAARGRLGLVPEHVEIDRQRVAKDASDPVRDDRRARGRELLARAACLRLASRLATEQEPEQLRLRVDRGIARQEELGIAEPAADLRGRRDVREVMRDHEIEQGIGAAVELHGRRQA